MLSTEQPRPPAFFIERAVLSGLAALCRMLRGYHQSEPSRRKDDV
jgi:hypothetical protein